MYCSVQYLTVSEHALGQRLDNFLIKHLKGVPRSKIYRIIRKGEVRVNGRRSRPHDKLCLGDQVRIPPVHRWVSREVCQANPLSLNVQDLVLHEDSDLMILNKPSGVAVHAGSGVAMGVIEWLRTERLDLDYLELVHRLDRETSGVLLISKSRLLLLDLQRDWPLSQKYYFALVYGQWDSASTGRIDLPLREQRGQVGPRVVVDDLGKPSQTDYRVMARFSGYTLLCMKPKTGRMHQIRVHLAAMGHPIVGDQRYAQVDQLAQSGAQVSPGLFLHARAVRLQCEFFKGKRFFKCPIPQMFKAFVQSLSLQNV